MLYNMLQVYGKTGPVLKCLIQLCGRPVLNSFHSQSPIASLLLLFPTLAHIGTFLFVVCNVVHLLHKLDTCSICLAHQSKVILSYWSTEFKQDAKFVLLTNKFSNKQDRLSTNFTCRFALFIFAYQNNTTYKIYFQFTVQIFLQTCVIFS